MALPAIIAGATRAVAALAGDAGAGRAVTQIAQMSIAFNSVGAAAQRATSSIGHLADSITGRMAKALTMWIGFVAEAARPIEHLVRVANPAIADAFGRAVQDAFGVVGRQLIPVMNAFTGVARKVGAVMAALEPVFAPAITAFAKLVDTVGNEFVKAAQENGPVFELMAQGLVLMAEAATVAARAVGSFVRMINSVYQSVARWLGFTGESMDNKRSAVGAAARHAQFVQPRAIADEAIRNSLMMGVGKNNEPQKDIKGVYDRIKDIYDYMQKRWGQVGAAVETGAKTADAVVKGDAPGVIQQSVRFARLDWLRNG